MPPKKATKPGKPKAKAKMKIDDEDEEQGPTFAEKIAAEEAEAEASAEREPNLDDIAKIAREAEEATDADLDNLDLTPELTADDLDK